MTVDADPRRTGAITTWRYVRVALIALIVGLGVSVAIQSFDEGRVLTSISDYYYTPAVSWFVGALVGVAVSMITLRGNTATENVLLNLAGACAPVVAFVPSACTTSSYDPCAANVQNNIPALLGVGAVGLAFATILVARKAALGDDRHPGFECSADDPHRASQAPGMARASANGDPPRVGQTGRPWAAVIAAALIWLVAVLAYWLEEPAFKEFGHYVAAIAMFACIFLVALSNTGGYRDHRQSAHPLRGHMWLLKNPYAYIAVLMVLSSLIIFIVWLINRFKHVLFTVEVDLIVLFGAFWVIQTKDLWKFGLRPGQQDSPVIVVKLVQRLPRPVRHRNAA